MSILNKLLVKFGKKKLFIIEAISLVFGGLSTFVLSYLTSKYAKEKGRKKLSLFIKYFFGIDIMLTALIFMIYPEGGKTFFTVSMYIASALCNVALIVIQNWLFKSETINNDTPEKIARKNKFIKIYVIVVLSLVGIILAGSFVLIAINEKRHVVDTNGPDNYDLQTIDDSRFLPGNLSSFGDRPSDGKSGESSGADEGGRDYDEIMFQMERMTGTKLIQSTRGLTDTLVLNFDTKVKSGNCELVIVHDSKIYQRVDVNCQQTIIIEDAKDKTYYVVVGAESANLEVNVTREFK